MTAELPTYEQLIDGLQDYPENERRAFYVVAVACGPITMTLLKKIMAEMKWPMPFVSTAWINEAKKKAILVTVDARFRLNEIIVEYCNQQVVLSGDYPALIKWVTKEVKADWKMRTFLDEFSIRAALYSNDIETFKKITKNLDPPFTPLHSLSTEIEGILYLPYRETWFTTLSDEWQFHLLYHMMEKTLQGYTTALTVPEIVVVLDQSTVIMAHPEGQCFRASIAICQGDMALAERLIPDVQSESSCALRGRLAFLHGNDDDALAHYKQAMSIKGKRVKKRLLTLTGDDAVFHLFACLRSKNMKLFHTSLQNIHKFAGNRYYFFEKWFSWVLDVHEQRKSLNDNTLNTYINGCPSNPFASLCLALGMRWLNPKLLSKSFSDALTDADFLKDHQLFWVYWELLQVFNNEGKKISKQDPCAAIWRVASEKMTAWGVVSCVDIIKEEPAWERSLRALDSLLNPTIESESTQQKAQRIVWIFQANKGKQGRLKLDEDLEVRLQVLNKNGAWSKGRIISFGRLQASSERHEDLPCLTPQDETMCNHIKEFEINNGYYHYHYETVIDMNAYDVLPDAIGHPALFIGDTKTPFHLEEGQVTLEVLQEKSNIRIKVLPFPTVDDLEDNRPYATVCQWETPQRMTFYRFNEEHLRIVQILGEKGLLVPKSAKARALESVAAIAPLLTVHSEIGGGTQQAAKEVKADPRLHMHLQPIGDGLQVSCFVRPFGEASAMLIHPGEGGKTLFTEHEGETLQTSRNLRLETKRSQKMFNSCTHLDAEEGWNWQINDPQEALETLEQLQELGDDAVLEWPEGKSIKLAQKMDMGKFSVSIHKHQDWFQVEGEVRLSDNDVIGVKQLLSLVEASSGRFIRLADDQFISLSQALYKRLNRLQKITDGGRFHSLAASAIDDATDGMNVRKNKSWQDHLQTISDAERYQPVLPSTLQAELRDYQVEGFEWMARLTHWGAGACLADDMGLGKTVQALALMLTHAPKGPALVIAPTSVCMNWEAEVARFAPSLRLHNFAEGDRAAMVANAGAFDVVVCSYALLQRNDAVLTSREWQMIVLDEAQAIKNAATKRSQAAMALQSPVRIITTGTPIENHLGELWNLFQFINPGLLGSLERFNQRFANPIQLQQNTEVAQHLKQLVHPFILRRLKSNVLTELPPRTEITMHIELPKEEMALYEAVRQKALERIQGLSNEPPGARQIKVLAEIMRLRRVCCHPSLVMPDTGIVGAKLTAFGECIKELRAGKHKALVFSQFIGHLAILRRYLDEEKIPYQYLDGSTPVKQRKKCVDAFQAGEGDVFLISLKAGGAGLNLTAADYVLHMDPWWNPAVEDQASDRAHRMGQKRPVTIYRFIAKNTIEDKIVQMHQQKRDLADTLLEGSDAGGKLSLAAIMKLVENASE